MELSIRDTDIITTLDIGKKGDLLWFNEIPHMGESTVKQSFLFAVTLLNNKQNKWDGVQVYLLNLNFLIVWRKSAV